MSNPSTPFLRPHTDRRSFQPNDNDGLQRHIRDCSHANGAWHSLRCKAEAADSFLGGRFISIVVVIGVVLAVSAYW